MFLTETKTSKKFYSLHKNASKSYRNSTKRILNSSTPVSPNQTMLFSRKNSVLKLKASNSQIYISTNGQGSENKVLKKVRRRVSNNFGDALSPYMKWYKVVKNYRRVDLEYKMLAYSSLYVRPGLKFYELLIGIAEEGWARIPFPSTVLRGPNGDLVVICTEGGVLRCRRMVLQDMHKFFLQEHTQMVAAIASTKGHCQQYLHTFDLAKNSLVPLVVCKKTKQNFNKSLHCSVSYLQFENTVLTAKMYYENRPRLTPDSVIQKYIFARNMKAIIFRLCFDRLNTGDKRQYYRLQRYQNVHPIFKTPSTLAPLLQIDYDKISFVEECTIQSQTLMNKFIIVEKELRNILYRKFHGRINSHYLDFTLDLFDYPWLLNLKFVNITPNQYKLSASSLLNIVASVANCKLCLRTFRKDQTNNSISAKKLIYFLEHLRKRMRAEDFKRFGFTDGLSLNRKDYAISAVCGNCYTMIVSELELIKYEKQLAAICHIRCNLQSTSIFTITPLKLYQWRLMLYFYDVKNVSRGVGNNLSLRYSLGKGIEYRWKCQLSDSALSLNQLKVHYFFSKEPNIYTFLYSTQITVSLVYNLADSEKVVALGSTAIISNFKSKFVLDNGQRQTTTVLLFFYNRKYCELILKIGLVWDGCYYIPSIALSKFNGILLAPATYVNSNPLPKEWMEAFGIPFDFYKGRYDYYSQTKYTDKYNLAQKDKRRF